MTLLTTMLDFTDTGEIGLLVTEEGVADARGGASATAACCKGSELAQRVRVLRANDLIWPYVVKGYLKGKHRPRSTCCYWNSDDTNLPGPMFCWYVRNTYLENKLRDPAPPSSAACRSTWARIDVPAFVYASQRGPHRAVEDGVREHPAARRGHARSCSGRAATSPA